MAEFSFLRWLLDIQPEEMLALSINRTLGWGENGSSGGSGGGGGIGGDSSPSSAAAAAALCPPLRLTELLDAVVKLPEATRVATLALLEPPAVREQLRTVGPPCATLDAAIDAMLQVRRSERGRLRLHHCTCRRPAHTPHTVAVTVTACSSPGGGGKGARGASSMTSGRLSIKTRRPLQSPAPLGTTSV